MNDMATEYGMRSPHNDNRYGTTIVQDSWSPRRRTRQRSIEWMSVWNTTTGATVTAAMTFSFSSALRLVLVGLSWSFPGGTSFLTLS